MSVALRGERERCIETRGGEPEENRHLEDLAGEGNILLK